MRYEPQRYSIPEEIRRPGLYLTQGNIIEFWCDASLPATHFRQQIETRTGEKFALDGFIAAKTFDTSSQRDEFLSAWVDKLKREGRLKSDDFAGAFKREYQGEFADEGDTD